MLCKTRGIVLHTIPYNDKYSIIYMYTEAFGRASYLVSRSRGKKSTVSKALFIPLSVCCDPVKNVLALFLSEVLFRVVKDTEPDPRLFDYLYESIHLLEYADKGIANFHMVFLLGLLHHLGIFPNMESHRVGYYFDMLNGVFTDHIPMHRHYLNKVESAFFSRLLRISFENMSLYGFSRQERARIIHRILEYYRLHLPDFPEIKSLSVMQSLFD